VSACSLRVLSMTRDAQVHLADSLLAMGPYAVLVLCRCWSSPCCELASSYFGNP